MEGDESAAKHNNDKGSPTPPPNTPTQEDTMTTPATDPRETILLECAAAAPNPWYPKDYAQAHGIRRDSLDPPLDELRLGGLIQLTDWVQGKGQGYQLTAEGKEFLGRPGVRERLRPGEAIARHRPTAEEPSETESVRTTTWDRGEAIREALLSPSPALVCFGLIALNVLVFLYGISVANRVQGNSSKYLEGTDIATVQQIGGLNGQFLAQGQWWRLITCCFVHFGWIHLAVNMYSLYALGPLSERVWGHGRFAVLYLIAGLGGSCAMAIANPIVNGAGASGAIWGILIALAVWVYLNRPFLPPALASSWLRQLIIVIFLNVVITFGVPNVSAAAHFGGGGVGLVLALLMQYQRFGHGALRSLALAGILAAPVLCIGAVVVAQHKLPRWQVVKGAQEENQLLNELVPQVRRTDQHALKVFETSVAPLLDQRDPRRRDHAAVKKAVAALEETRGELSDAARLLENAGPYDSPPLEEARQTRLDFLRERIKYFEMVERYLREGQRDDTALIEQAKQVDAAGRRWSALLQ